MDGFEKTTAFTVYRTTTEVLAFIALTALILSLIFLGRAIWGWRMPSRTRRLKTALIAFLVVPVATGVQQAILWYYFLPSLGAWNQQLIDQGHDEDSILHVDDHAPEFTVVDTEGTSFSLEEHRGKLVLVNFFATWCGPCRIELPQLQEIWNQHRLSPQFAMIVIGRGEDLETVQKFRNEQNYSLPMAPDPEGSIYSQFATKLIPRTYIVDPNGKIAFLSASAGENEIAELKHEVQARLRSLRASSR